MKINNISIQNFRSFAECKLHFAEQTTILIGKNGSGKSNLIAALKTGLSFIFAKDPNFARSLSDSNGCAVRNFSLCWDTRFDEQQKGFCLPVSIHCDASFSNQILRWDLTKNTVNSHTSKAGYQEALHLVLNHFNKPNENASMPVLVFFSDAFPHKMAKIPAQYDRMVHHAVLPRDLAYFDWDLGNNCSELWQERYRKIHGEVHDFRYELEDLRRSTDPQQVDRREFLEQLPYRKQCNLELDFVNNRLLRFTAPLHENYDFINKDFEIQRIVVSKPDKKTSSMGFVFKNGKQMFFDNLPQGYKRLLSMVFDITYRSFILNEHAEPEGIVFIDEIELHLHPSLQQEVMERFKVTFPKIQFIVSTHSPIVISNLNDIDGVKNQIIKLSSEGLNYSQELIRDNIYGIDYATSLSDFMEVDHRHSSLANLIDTYVILRHLKMEEEAIRIKEEIDGIVGVNNKRIESEIAAKLEANL